MQTIVGVGAAVFVFGGMLLTGNCLFGTRDKNSDLVSGLGLLLWMLGVSILVGAGAVWMVS